MRIVIDLQGAQTESRFRGIGRYSLSLAKAIARNRGEHDIILVLSGYFQDTIEPIRAAFDELLPQENIRVWYGPEPVCERENGNTWRRETAELLREAFLLSLQPDIIHVMSLFEGYIDDAVTSIGRFDQTTPVSVIHFDLIPLLNPEHYLSSNPSYERFYRRKIKDLQQSSLLLTISEYSKKEGEAHLDLNPESIINISTAADDNFYPISLSKKQEKDLLNKFGLSRSVILYTGGADERKNLPLLIQAYAQLSVELRNSHQLVFAGKMPKSKIIQLQQEAKYAGLLSDELVFTGYVTEDILVKLYNLCKLYVFPSWHEGFGLPALEAMSCGAAVIAANTSSLPEVIGNTDALFDISSKEDIALKISSVLTNDSLHESLRHKGLVQSKKFNWDQSAKIAISAIENYIENNNNHCNRLPSTQILVNKIAEVIPADLSEKNLLNIASIIGQNHPQCGLKQLFIDVSELSQRDAATGVQRVTRSILTQLLNNPPVGFRVEPVYATTQNSGYYYARKYTAKLQGQSGTTDLDEPLMPMAGDIFFGLDLQHHVVIKQADYFKQLKRQNVSLYFVVYDLLPITFSKYFPEEHSTLHAKWLEVISKFDGLSCISATVAEELDEWLGINFPDRKSKLNITYFNLGADIENSVPSKGLTRDYIHVQSLLKNSFNFLVVGTLEPRKGQEQVLLAFEELWAKGVDANLVLVGKQGWMVDDLIEKIQNHSKLGIKLFWLNGISDEYLEKIYSESTCLIAASEGEGFGLPLIEAAQHELPVIARDIPVFREVAGGHAYYFKGEEPTGLAHYIEEWIILYREQKHPTSNNMPWISWKQSADIIISNIFGCEKICPVKQLFLDISELVQHDAKSGIQRVVRSLLKELLINPPEGFRVEPVYATIDHGYRYANKFTTKFLNRSEFALNDELIEYRAGDIFLGLDLQPQVVTVHQSFYQKIRRHGVQVQFIVHDLLPVTNPDWFCEGADKGYSQWLKIITQSDGAICVSKVTANELQAWINKNNVSTTRPFRITVSHNGADIENSSPSKGMPENCNEVLITLNKYPSFLMVGTIEPRKAYAQTLAAFENLWDKNIEINLVIVGKEGWMVEAVIEKLNKHPELGKHLFWLKGISDEYLEKIYGASTCLIAASEGEGFGLPLIEAAQHKLPIIARDIPVYREVAGNQAYYFNGKTPNQLADSVEDWIRLNEQIMVPDSSCMRFLTWKVSAQQLIKNLLSNREGEES